MPESLVAPPLPGGRRAVLYAVRRQGEATADQVAERLGITVSGARQHLTALLEAGLVDCTVLPRPSGQRGRPQQAYSVTPAAEALFPKAYGELTNELLGYLEESGPDLVDGIFERRREQRIAKGRIRLDRHPTLEAKVAELTKILDEDGYLAEWEPLGDGGFRIAEQNCAILAVASRFGQACSSELDFIQAVLPGTDVRRVSHMVSGGRCCAYEIQPLDPAPA
jgi:DeoR family transcriptional regulator, suf operon transcriptional repressor